MTGVVLTKLDGTAKGGIVLAIQAELGIPVKVVGVGGVGRRPRRLRPDGVRRRPARRVILDASMFDALSDRFDGIFTRCAAAGG